MTALGLFWGKSLELCTHPEHRELPNLKWLKKSKKAGSRWQRIGQWQVKHAGSGGGLTGCLHHNMVAGNGQAAPSRLPRPLRRGPTPLLRHPFPLNINKLLRKKPYSLGGDGGCPETPVQAHGFSRWFVDKGAMLPPPMTQHGKLGHVSWLPSCTGASPMGSRKTRGGLQCWRGRGAHRHRIWAPALLPARGASQLQGDSQGWGRLWGVGHWAPSSRKPINCLWRLKGFIKTSTLVCNIQLGCRDSSNSYSLVLG